MLINQDYDKVREREKRMQQPSSIIELKVPFGTKENQTKMLRYHEAALPNTIWIKF